MKAKVKIKGKDIVFAVILSCVIAIAFLLIGRQKAHYHMDEICTFGLSNGALHMEHELGKVYTGEELFRDYVTADKDNRFDYKTVWENQAKDVHPPLYYVFIHTLSSLIAGQYSDLIGLLPNILFAVVIYWQMCWMLGFFTKRKNAMLLSGLYIFTAAFVNIVVFFRMYALLTLITNALFMLFLRYVPYKDKNKYFYIGLYITVVCGMLTHYYFAVIAGIACGVYGLQLLYSRRIKDAVAFVASGLAGVVTAVVIFPKMIHHILFGYRGKQAVTALLTDDLYESARQMLSLVDKYLLGGIAVLLALIILVLWLTAKNQTEETNQSIKYFVLQFIVPAVCYICVIAKIAPFKDERYITNVTGVIWFAVFAMILILTERYKEKGGIFALILAAVIVVFSYQSGVPNLQKSEAWKGRILDNRASLPCVYVYDYCWRVISNYVEMQELEEITFLDPSTIDLIDDERFSNNEAMLVYISNEVVGTEFLDRIVENNPDIEGYEMLFYSGYSTCYLLD